MTEPNPADLQEIVKRYRDTMGLTREGAIRRLHVLMDAVEDAALRQPTQAAEMERLRAALQQSRSAVIEECARIAENEKYADSRIVASWHDGDDRPQTYNTACVDIATAIRALSQESADVATTAHQL